jgi:hypothetical protein
MMTAVPITIDDSFFLDSLQERCRMLGAILGSSLASPLCKYDVKATILPRSDAHSHELQTARLKSTQWHAA